MKQQTLKEFLDELREFYRRYDEAAIMIITKRTQDIPTHLEGIVFDIYQHEYYNKKTDMYLSDDDVEFHQLKPTAQVKQFKEGEAVAQLSYFKAPTRRDVTIEDIVKALKGEEVIIYISKNEQAELLGAVRRKNGQIEYLCKYGTTLTAWIEE